MKVSAFFLRFAVGVCASVTFLMGCSGLATSTTPPIAQQSNVTIGGPGRAESGASWMAPDAKSQSLLYVSNTSHSVGDVYVYSYPGGRSEGELSGVSPAGGLCSDNRGNVFIPAGNRIVEYAHGGTQPIAVLDDPFGRAQYCSVDPMTGDLAVSPTVAIYAHAKGKPKAYDGGNDAGNNSCAYDGEGNLFVNGWVATTGSWPTMGLVELRKGADKFTKIDFPFLPFSTTIQWDGKYLAVGATSDTIIRRYRVVGKRARRAGPMTWLKDSLVIGQFWVSGSTVIVPNEPYGSGAGRVGVYFYQYPHGGAATKIVKGLNEPAGVTVSLALK